MPAPDNRIDLNSADVALLTQLPGVAKNVAYAIVNYRALHGGFAGWEDLQKVTPFSTDKKKLDALKARAFLGHDRQSRASPAASFPGAWESRSTMDFIPTDRLLTAEG